jgi:hypothetical protein
LILYYKNAIIEVMKGINWVAMSIGCLECGVDSYVIGTFKTKDAAQKAAEREEILYAHGEFYDGQRDFRIFEITVKK